MTDVRELAVVRDVPDGLLIGGAWRAGRRTFPVVDPATEQPLREVTDASVADGLAALDAACSAAAQWRATAPRERSEILRRAFELMLARADDLALLMTLEMGKPLAEARGEVAYAAEFFRWFAEEAVRVSGTWMRDPATSAGRLVTAKEPVGPALLITPWNFPLAMGTRKIGPALAAGCPVIVKPAAQTPLSMLALAALLQESGVPDGVVNVVTTTNPSDVVAALMADARLRKVSFTGSTAVGRVLARQAGDQLQRVSLELGGNAPFVVFDDADLDLAVGQAVIAKMRNIGQSCVAANRFHVHDAVADEFAMRLAARLRDLPLGRGTDPDAKVGPLIDDVQLARVQDLVADAVDRGAKVVTGGDTHRPGYFHEPTVLADVDAGADMRREEIFGPVAPVYRFAGDDDAVTAANDTEYGLVAYVFTNDLRRAMRLVDSLDVGMVGINKGLVSNPAAPFGGVKASGIGREGGREGIEEYLTTKYIALDA